MPKTKLYLLALGLFSLQATLFAYNLSTFEFDKLFSYSKEVFQTTFSTQDTIPSTDDPPDSETRVAEITAMFNERGFYNSSSNTIDENEIINDFSGNLQYTFPLFNMKGAGDIDVNFSLNYNGSMAHSFFPADASTGYAGNQVPQYSFTAPGWIFSFNGMGVQMTNFETNWFTQNQTGAPPSAIDNGVRLLANGYQLTEQKKANLDGKDEIYLLLGDGSVMTLRRKGSLPGLTKLNVGEYYSADKGSYVRAKVSYNPYLENLPDNDQLRRAEVFMGDGLVYTYESIKSQFRDYTINDPNSFNRPKVFYLNKIEDRYGNNVKFFYIHQGLGSNAYYGRAFLRRIECSWNDPENPGNRTNIYLEYFLGSNAGKIIVKNESNEIFEISVTGTSHEVLGTHRAYIEKIKNPAGQIANISNNGYARQITNLCYNNYNLTDFSISLQNSNLYRIGSVTNYVGGKRDYYYFSGGSLTYEMLTPPGHKNDPHIFLPSNISTYKGQGRDPFFTNMLGSVEYRTSAALSWYKKLAISYHYDPHERVYYFDPVDEDDDYYTEFKCQSNNGMPHESTITERYLTKHYKIFQVETDGELLLANGDYNGETKLVIEDDGSNQGLTRRMEYDYDKGTPILHGDWGYVYTGSFLPTKTKVTENNGLTPQPYYETTTEYQYMSDFPYSGTDYKNPIASKTDIDPFGNKVKTEYKHYYDSSYHYFNAKFSPGGSMKYTRFYSINNVLQIDYMNSSNTLLKRISNAYINNNSSTNGYMGQLIETKEHLPSNPNSFYLSTLFDYYKEDTLGLYLYDNYGKLPPKEGNLKKTTDPKGKSTTYYYHPVSPYESIIGPGTPSQTDYEGIIPEPDEITESIILPRVAYMINYEGHTSLVSSYWQNLSLPTRIDMNVEGSYNLTNYYSYNPSGLTFKYITPNKNLVSLYHDKINRIEKVLLPYDFNDQQVYDSIVYDTTFTVTEHDDFSYPWGYLSYDGFSPAVTWLQNIDLVNLDYSFSQQSGTNYTYPLFAFPVQNYIQDDIEYAQLTFKPTYYQKTDPLIIEMKPITSFSINQPSVSFGSQFVALGALNTWNYVGNCEDIRYNIDSFTHEIDVTSLINPNFKGLAFTVNNSAAIELDDPENIYTAGINIGHCLNYQTYWNHNRPRLFVRSVKKNITSTIIKVYPRSTLRYIYDDGNNSVEVRSKIDMINSTTQRSKKSQHYFDGFYRLKKSKLYTSSTSYDSLQFEYNYLDLRSKSIDARNNQTIFSYDKYLINSKTQNADNSETLLNNSYGNSFSNHFGTINDYINVQEFVDETGKKFIKYFDAVSNLRREVKFTEFGENDPDLDNPQQSPFHIITDYDYDDLYRLIAVRTPNNKNITYSYDGYGRVSQRVTPDAGTTRYKYDNNGNLTYSQDQNQASTGANCYTFRYYDGLNRMTGLGTSEGGLNPVWNDVNGNEPFEEDNPNDPYANFLLINIYDTTSNAPSGIFTAPSNYGTNNMTKGNLVATAYKTSKLDPWNLKYYRYDARGRITKMWHKIVGLPDWKEVDYTFNSADLPVYLNYQPTKYDSKLYQYLYDDAARLNNVKVYGEISPEDPDQISNPGMFESFISYGYNQNSQIQGYQFSNLTSSNYTYNNRNWITNFDNDADYFDYDLTYYANGNVETQELYGDYKEILGDKTQLLYEYTYDKSNRLLKADQVNSSGFSVRNSYDKDGNILSLKRWDVGGSLEDNFSYQYISGTNKLRRVSGSVDQFYYDGNGNMIADSLNGTYNITYDHRNLIVQLYYKRYEEGAGLPVLRTFSEFYKYDDAGNRIKKVIMKYTGTAQDPTIEDSGDAPPNWNYELIQHYVRDVTGNELAVYNDTTVTFWNVYGIDNAGRINYSDDSWNFYLKDHLGSVRCVIDGNGDIISAEDLDMWGYRMTDRSFQSDTTFYKYTGKERDVTTGYDYFGARYYDSRIGRWGQVEPLLEKYPSVSPYNYGLNRPILLRDINGLDVDFTNLNANDRNALIQSLKNATGFDFKVNDANKLEIVDRTNFEGGSEIARELIINAIDASQTLKVHSTDEDRSFAYLGLLDVYLSSSQINAFMKGVRQGLNPETVGWALTFFHEMQHTRILKNQLDDNIDKAFGPIIDLEPEYIVNKIRKQLGKDYGQRQSYLGVEKGGYAYIAFDSQAKSFIFGSNKNKGFIFGKHVYVEVKYVKSD